MIAVEEISSQVGTAAACEALDVSRATVYRRRSPPAPQAGPAEPRPPSHRALTLEERQAVLAVLNDPEFMDKPPAVIHATLLDQGKYLCSVRTMYRILTEEGQVKERRDQLRHPVYKRPELVAKGPNQVWSWDITKLKGPAKGVHYSLYALLDVFSRYVVGWLIAESERASLATRLIAESCHKQGIEPGQLTLHADRGAPMTAKTTAQLLADLDIAESHSRPRVSNDNPFSESHFRTMKYRPEVPDRFASKLHAIDVFRGLFRWYNTAHRHSALAYMTPEDVHLGRVFRVMAQRQRVLDEASSRWPERFPRKPVATAPPAKVWINPPAKGDAAESIAQ